MESAIRKLIDSNRDLQRKNQILETFWEEAEDLLAIADGQGTFLKVSDSWEYETGWTCDELTAKPFTYFVVEDDLSKTIREDQAITSGEGHADFVNRYRRKDGGTVKLQWRSSLARNGFVYGVARVIERTDAEP